MHRALPEAQLAILLLPMRPFRNASLCRGLLYIVIGFAVCQLVVLNCTIMFLYFSIRSELSGFFASKANNLMDKLMTIPSVKNLIFEGKGGGFLKLIQHTIERGYIVTREPRESTTDGESPSSFDRSEISYLSLDVSSAGEALYLIRRMKQRGKAFSKNYKQLIIDIGANDGLMSSNSFNLIQLGWDAILVEPQRDLLDIAHRNIGRYTDHSHQSVQLVNAVIGEKDGFVDFALMSADMESHVLDPDRADLDYEVPELVVQVPSYTVTSFAAKFNVPRNVGILSIDAEGVGDKILHQWIDGGFRPAYIVYEPLHNQEPEVVTTHYLNKHGYQSMIKMGWNIIYEHRASEKLTAERS